jgi:hypothetical protein
MTSKNRRDEKKLAAELERLYTSEQIDNFQWYVDKEDDKTYRFDYIDHEGNRKNLILNKESGDVTCQSV